MGATVWPHRRGLGAVLALALVGSVCSDDGSGDEAAEAAGTGAAEAVLAPATRVLDDEEAENLEVLADRILVPEGHELADVAVDDVIALGLTDQTPNGLLRLVTAVDDEGGQVVASTRQATLGEAFDELDLSFSAPLRFERVVPADEGDAMASRAGARTPAARARIATAAYAAPAAQEPTEEETDAIEVEENDEGFVVSFEELLYDGDDDPSTTDDNVTLSGSVAVEVALNVELDVDIDLVDVNADVINPLSVADPKLESAKLEIDGNVSTNLQFDARQATPPFGSNTEVFAIEGAPIVIQVGPVPVVVRLRMPIVVGWDGRVSAAASTSVTTSTDVRLGVEYDDGNWDPIDQVDPPEYDFNPPELDDADPGSVAVRAGPRLEVRVYETLASGSVGVDGTIEVDLLGSPPWFCLYAGARALVGFRFLGEPVYDNELRPDRALLLPDECDAGASLPEDVVPVSGYSRVFGTCTPLGEHVSEWGQRIAALRDGGVVVAAAMARDAPEGTQEARWDDLWLLRLDAAGEVVWTRTYRGFVGDLVGLVPTPQGFVVALETGRMLFLDDRGDILEARRLRGLAFHLRGLTGLPGGDGFLALGVEGTTPVLAELDPAGTARWARRYRGGLADGAARAGSRRGDGGWNVAIGAGDFLAVGPTGELEHAVRLHVDGALVPRLGTKTAGAVGTLGAMVDRAIVIVDAELENAVGSDQGPATWGRALDGRADGDFVGAGAFEGVVLGRVSSAGALRWLVGYRSGDRDSALSGFSSVTSTNDGGVVGVGGTRSLATQRCGDQFEPGELPPMSNIDVWVLKVPSTGLMTPADDSGLQRASLDRELVDRTYELVPIEANDEPFPLEVTADDPVPVITNYPSIDSHLPDLAEGEAPRTIPAGQFEPHEPTRIVYEYTKGGPVSDRVTVAWDGDNLSVTHFEADVFDRGAPQGSFRYLFGPAVSIDGGGCYLEEATGCGQLFGRVSSTNGAFFPPGPISTVPRFEGTLPAIEVDRPEVWAGLEAACGIAVDELIGEIDLCVHEQTGAVLYAHTITRCDDPDRTDETCVELGAVEVGEPTAEDFSLPGQ